MMLFWQLQLLSQNDFSYLFVTRCCCGKQFVIDKITKVVILMTVLLFFSFSYLEDYQNYHYG